MLRVLLSITVAVCCGTANAEVTKSDGNFYCGAIADWDLANFRLSPDLVVNNFCIRSAEFVFSKWLGRIGVDLFCDEPEERSYAVQFTSRCLNIK